MKNTFKLYSLLTVFSFMLFQACTKDEKQIFLEGGTAPVLATSAVPDTVALLKANKSNILTKLSWTNPEYHFTTGVSSQNVSYILQVDLAGGNFSSSKLQEKAVSSDLGYDLTVGELNGFLTKMELMSGVPHNIQMRIVSTLGNKSAPLYSNVLKFIIIPYLDFIVEPPGTASANYTDGNLWMTGDATTSGYSNPLPNPYDVTQKFTKIDVLHYVLDSVNFTNGSGHYKLIQTQGVWGTQYHAINVTATSAGNTGDLEKKDADPGFAAPGIGWYKVEVNFQTGKYTQTKL